MATKLFCADYSAIEARVLFWLAGHGDGIAAFRDNRPIYEEMAQRIFGKQVDNPSPERELGKRAVLGCGYNMGWKKFKETCWTFGEMKVADELAQRAVSAYREMHWPVPVLWKTTEASAQAAVRKPLYNFLSGKCVWSVVGGFLLCTLPSGRKLAYYKPEIRSKRTDWGEIKPTLYHQGVNPVTRKWGLDSTYGGKLVENVTQAVARDLMAEAMLRVEASGYRVVLSVHDEIVAENERGSVEEFENLLAQTPAWASNLPVKVSGWSGERYRK